MNGGYDRDNQNGRSEMDENGELTVTWSELKRQFRQQGGGRGGGRDRKRCKSYIMTLAALLPRRRSVGKRCSAHSGGGDVARDGEAISGVVRRVAGGGWRRRLGLWRLIENAGESRMGKTQWGLGKCFMGEAKRE